MRVPLADVGRKGRLDLVFGVREDRTVLLDSYCEVPFKITRILRVPDPSVAHLMLMQCTPGLFGGDRLEMNIVVEPGARVVLSQQSATRVHPAEEDFALQRTRVHVGAGASLEMLLEPVIPFLGARLDQTMEIEASPDTSVIYWEGLMAGRIGRGEFWSFSELKSETSLKCEDRLVYLDRFHLMPELLSPDQRWMMGANRYLGTGLFFGNGTAERAGRIRELLPTAGVDSPADKLAVIRLACEHGPEYHRSRELFALACETGGAALPNRSGVPYSSAGETC